MDAIVTAGGIPLPEDPLYPYTNGDSKAMVDVAGKPMIQWVLDALGDAKHIDKVIVIGLSPKTGVTCKKPLHYVSNQGRMLANIVAGVNKSLEIDPKTRHQRRNGGLVDRNLHGDQRRYLLRRRTTPSDGNTLSGFQPHLHQAKRHPIMWR